MFVSMCTHDTSTPHLNIPYILTHEPCVCTHDLTYIHCKNKIQSLEPCVYESAFSAKNQGYTHDFLTFLSEVTVSE